MSMSVFPPLLPHAHPIIILNAGCLFTSAGHGPPTEQNVLFSPTDRAVEQLVVADAPCTVLTEESRLSFCLS